MHTNTLAARLQAALDRKPGATKAALARACQVKGPSVVDWFNGKTLSLKGRSLVRAAAYLGVDAGWLATGSGSPGWTDAQHSFAGEPPARWEVAESAGQGTGKRPRSTQRFRHSTASVTDCTSWRS